MVRYDWGAGDGELLAFFRPFAKARPTTPAPMMRTGLRSLDMAGRRVTDGCQGSLETKA
jgi:hypothetical protein